MVSSNERNSVTWLPNRCDVSCVSRKKGIWVGCRIPLRRHLSVPDFTFSAAIKCGVYAVPMQFKSASASYTGTSHPDSPHLAGCPILADAHLVSTKVPGCPIHRSLTAMGGIHGCRVPHLRPRILRAKVGRTPTTSSPKSTSSRPEAALLPPQWRDPCIHP